MGGRRGSGVRGEREEKKKERKKKEWDKEREKHMIQHLRHLVQALYTKKDNI